MTKLRRALAGTLLPIALLITSPVAAAPLTNTPEQPVAIPFEAEVFGRKVSDPYRWMEAPAKAADVRAWLQSASDHTRREFDRLAGYEGLVRDLVAGGAADGRDGSLTTRGATSFRLHLAPGDALAKLVVRDPAGLERVLYDPAAPAATGAVNNYSVSPNGRRVAVHTAPRGTEVGAIRVVDVTTGAIDPQGAGPVWGQFPAAWISDDAFLYVQAPSQDGARALANATLRLRRLGGPHREDAVLLRGGGPEGLAAEELFSVDPEVGSPWTLLLATGARAERRLFVARDEALARGQTLWREVAGYGRRITVARLSGDALYVVSTQTAANGEVRRIDLTSGREEVVLPAGDLVLQNIMPAEDGVYVSGLAGGFERLLFLPRSARKPIAVALPPGGAVDDLEPTGDGRGVTLAHAGWLSNRAYFRVERGRAAPLGYAGAATPASLAKFEVLQDEATSRDGTRVPLTILAPRNLSRDGRAVTVLDAYGGYGHPVRPFYRTEFHAWLARGGVFAFCGVRGGGDKGRSWHEAGRAANKPKAQQDFVACGERLVKLGFTTPARLVAHGASNGALVVGPAVLQRPDLFRGAVLRKGMLNATRIGASGNGPNHYAEMGDPADPKGYAGLEAQDAYLTLERAAAAPDLLLTVGLNDSRVEPWFSAKFAARALARFGDRSKVLVAAADSGHAVGDTREQLAREAAAVMAFSLSITGDAAFQVGPERSGAEQQPLAPRCARTATLPAEAADPALATTPAPSRFSPNSPYKRRRC